MSNSYDGPSKTSLTPVNNINLFIHCRMVIRYNGLVVQLTFGHAIAGNWCTNDSCIPLRGGPVIVHAG